MGDQLKKALESAGLNAVSKQSHARTNTTGDSNRQKAAEPEKRSESLNPIPRVPFKTSPPGRKSTAPMMPIKTKPSNAPAARERPQVASIAELASIPDPPKIVKTGEFCPHPLLDPALHEEFTVAVSNEFAGITGQLAGVAEDETDMVIGLDFGTSTTKVVIRDRFSEDVFPIQFHADQDGIARYLLASSLGRSGGISSLSNGDIRLADLKLRLLSCKARWPVTEFNDCCAYLALVIRQARVNLLTTYRSAFEKKKLNWFLNLGLAARSYEDEHLVRLFRCLAIAAMATASDETAPEIREETVDRHRRAVFDLYRDPVAVLPPADDTIDVVPEVSAQLHGFMTSARWDWSARPIMMLVDVGAGTVDSALFRVHTVATGDPRLTFYASRVEPNGVMNLHRQRVEWLLNLLPRTEEHLAARTHLEEVAHPTGRLRPIPTTVAEYLPGYVVESGSGDVDETFRMDRFRRQVAGSIFDTKVKKGLDKGELMRVPLLLCGGGSRMALYGSIAEEINGTPGWYYVSVELTRMPVPDDLAETGWHADDFDRLSVAYGLSLAGKGEKSLGRIVRSIEVPDVSRRRRDDGSDDRYVSKDQM